MIKEYRKRGCGKQFLDYFEDYMKSNGCADLVFYADHPAALAALRRHDYREVGYLEGSKEYVFYHTLNEALGEARAKNSRRR